MGDLVGNPLDINLYRQSLFGFSFFDSRFQLGFFYCCVFLFHLFAMCLCCLGCCCFSGFSPCSQGPLGDPLGGRFSSRRLSVLLALMVLPLNLSLNSKPSCFVSFNFASNTPSCFSVLNNCPFAMSVLGHCASEPKNPP